MVSSGMTRAFSSGGKIGSTDWCWCFVVPPVFSLAALLVATSPPTEACAETPASAAAPQSHGRPVLGQSYARSQSQALETDKALFSMSLSSTTTAIQLCLYISGGKC